jgi:hypothetical protein
MQGLKKKKKINIKINIKIKQNKKRKAKQITPHRFRPRHHRFFAFSLAVCCC